MRESINVGLVGLGVIGGGVAKILNEKAEEIAKQVGVPLLLKRVADLDETKRNLPFIDSTIFTTDGLSVFEDPDLDLVIELIGGESPAKDFIERALRSGKHVITANKEVRVARS